MRSLFAGLIVLSASIAVVDTAQAQIHPQRPPGCGSIQVPIGHRQPTQDDLRPTQDDLEKVDKDNLETDLAASRDGTTGAGQVRSEEDALTKRIEQDDVRLDGKITDICPSCGGDDAPPVHQQPRPIHNGFNHLPTRNELRALHQEDVARARAREIDLLHGQLMSSGNQILRRHPARAP